MNAMAEWWRAQLDKEERVALAAREDVGRWAIDVPLQLSLGPNVTAHALTWSPARALEEIRAKRAVVDLWEAVGATPDMPPVAWVVLRDAVQALMAVYVDRPGYRDEWRP